MLYQQVDVLPFKNQALEVKPLLIPTIQHYLMMSHEQRLITKEHIAMHANLILPSIQVSRYYSPKINLTVCIR